MFINDVKEITTKNKKENNSTAKKQADDCYESKIKPLIIQAAEKGYSYINVCFNDLLENSLVISEACKHLEILIRLEGFVCYESEERNDNAVFTIAWG